MNSNSVTHHQYPQIRFHEGRRWLWNPVRKQLLKNRPEERVRLETIEFLHRRGNIPYSRMTTELPVKPDKSEHSMRSDILVFGRDMKPYLLTECKSRDVKLTPAAALQAAQYNSKIHAEFVLITNGLKDVLFKTQGDGIEEVSTKLLYQSGEPERDTGYWSERGFCAPNPPVFLPNQLQRLYSEEQPVSFFDVPPLENQPDFSHYYSLFESRNQQGWAVAIVSGKPEETWGVGLKFTGGTATAAISVCFNTLIVYLTTFRQPMETVTLHDYKSFIEDELWKKNTPLEVCLKHLYEIISARQ